MEANQTLHDVWPCPGLVHHLYIFGGSWPVTEFCQVQNSLCVQVLRYSILAALVHGTEKWASAKLCGVVSSCYRAAIWFDIGRSNCLVGTVMVEV